MDNHYKEILETSLACIMENLRKKRDIRRTPYVMGRLLTSQDIEYPVIVIMLDLVSNIPNSTYPSPYMVWALNLVKSEEYSEYEDILEVARKYLNQLFE